MPVTSGSESAYRQQPATQWGYPMWVTGTCALGHILLRLEMRMAKKLELGADSGFKPMHTGTEFDCPM